MLIWKLIDKLDKCYFVWDEKNCDSNPFTNFTKHDFISLSLLIAQVGIKHFCVSAFGGGSYHFFLSSSVLYFPYPVSLYKNFFGMEKSH